jgi:hypothetical protein
LQAITGIDHKAGRCGVLHKAPEPSLFIERASTLRRVNVQADQAGPRDVLFLRLLVQSGPYLVRREVDIGVALVVRSRPSKGGIIVLAKVSALDPTVHATNRNEVNLLGDGAREERTDLRPVDTTGEFWY